MKNLFACKIYSTIFSSPQKATPPSLPKNSSPPSWLPQKIPSHKLSVENPFSGYTFSAPPPSNSLLKLQRALMTPHLATRPLEESDWNQWLPLWEAYLQFYGTSLPRSVSEHTFFRLTRPNISPHGWVAQSSPKEVVGIAHFLFHPTTWDPHPVCYLQDLYVSPQMRGQGIGKQLIEAVKKAATAHGSHHVHWLTAQDNLPARQLYDQVASLTPFIRYQWKKEAL